MTTEIKNDAEERMKKSISALQTEFARLRTGRAHPSLLDHIRVESYGSQVPLNQVSSINVSDSRTITITPWEKTMVSAIEKSIMDSELGLNPATTGGVIRIPIPPLNEERRRDLVKIVRNEAESAKISIRNIRRDANQQYKELLKEKQITEDEERRAQDSIQKLTNQYIGEIDNLLNTKEGDLMEI